MNVSACLVLEPPSWRSEHPKKWYPKLRVLPGGIRSRRACAEESHRAVDTNNLLTSVTDANGNVTSIQRDGSGNATAIVAPGGQTTTLTMDGSNNLASVADPAGNTYRFTYFPGSLLATETDRRGGLHQFTYDPQGLLIKDQDPAGGFTALSRTILNNGWSVTSSTELGRFTTDTVCFLSTGAMQQTHTGAVCACDRSRQYTGLDGTVITTADNGTVTTIVQGPDPRPGFGMQSPINQSTTIVTPGGLQSVASGSRSVILTDPTNPLSVQCIKDCLTVNGNTNTSVFNRNNLTLTQTSPASRVSLMMLDTQDRPISQQADPTVVPVAFTYDPLGRVVTIKRGDKSATLGYDTKNRLASLLDAANNQTAFQYNLADLVSQTTLPDLSPELFNYDPNGNLVQLILPSAAVHGFTYTPVNLQASYTPPTNSPFVSTYNLDRDPTQTTLPGGRTITGNYDSGGRPISTSYDAATITYGYTDSTNRITSVARTPTGTGIPQVLGFSYDGSLVTGRAFSGTATGQYSYQYDNNFRVVGYTLDSNPQISLARDVDGLSISNGPFTITRGGPAGAISQISDGTLQVSYAYDSLGRLQTRTHTVNGSTIYQLQLTYSNVGLITQRTETTAAGSHTFVYTYDRRGRVTVVTEDGTTTEQYVFDANNNRSSRQLGAAPIELATYDTQDRLVTRGTTAYQFNGDGYLTARNNDTFQVSAVGELLQVNVSAGSFGYGYDGMGRRVSRTDSSGTTQYLYSALAGSFQLSASRSPTSTLTQYFYDDAGSIIACQCGGVMKYVAADQVGSPRVFTDNTGAVQRSVDYDSFGNITADTAPTYKFPLGYAGGLADAATGLVRFGYRDYEPASGRWIQRDPIGFQGGMNQYAYVLNSPVMYRDPTGLIFGIDDLIELGVLASAFVITNAYELTVAGIVAAEAVAPGAGAGALGGITSTYSTGNPLNPSNLISLDAARQAAIDAGIDMRMFSLNFESVATAGEGAYGFISQNGAGALIRSGTGQFALTLTENGLASRADAAMTIAHELRHVRSILSCGNPGTEAAAEGAARSLSPFLR